MPGQYDFKKEWKKTQVQLSKFSKEAAKMAKKGEKGIVEFSRKSKLFIDSKAISLKKVDLYYLIGKEYVKANTPAQPTVKMNKLLRELKKDDRKQRALNKKIKTVKK